MLGTLPDLDAVWFRLSNADVVTEVTWHRGPSHSLLVLSVLSVLIWLLWRRFSPALREQPPWRSWLIVWLPLITHPLLDAFTVYGTQLWWPLSTPPVMWASIFIIDPLYTLPLLLGVSMAWRCAPPLRKAAGSAVSARSRSLGADAARTGQRWLLAGVLLSTAYLGWSLLAKQQVERHADKALAVMGLERAPRVASPLPFNTLLWRVVVMTPEGYLIGDRSLLADRKPMTFRFFDSGVTELAQLRHLPEVQRLLWFTHGFVRAQIRPLPDGSEQLLLDDLRMGLEPDYFFRYVLADRPALAAGNSAAAEKMPAHGRAAARQGRNRPGPEEVREEGSAAGTNPARDDAGRLPACAEPDSTACASSRRWLPLPRIARVAESPAQNWRSALAWVWRRLFDPEVLP